VPGYGIYATQQDIDDCVYSSRDSPTRLMRNLLTIFFPRRILAALSVYGSRSNRALDKSTSHACLRKSWYVTYEYSYNCNFHTGFVQSRHSDRSPLINAMNDKCANARRNLEGNKKIITERNKENYHGVTLLNSLN